MPVKLAVGQRPSHARLLVVNDAEAFHNVREVLAMGTKTFVGKAERLEEEGIDFNFGTQRACFKRHDGEKAQDISDVAGEADYKALEVMTDMLSLPKPDESLIEFSAINTTFNMLGGTPADTAVVLSEVVVKHLFRPVLASFSPHNEASIVGKFKMLEKKFLDCDADASEHHTKVYDSIVLCCRAAMHAFDVLDTNNIEQYEEVSQSQKCGDDDKPNPMEYDFWTLLKKPRKVEFHDAKR